MNGYRQALLITLIMIVTMSETVAGGRIATSDLGSASIPVDGISEQRAMTIAKQHFKGRVLAINRTDHLYRIKLLSNQGTVHTILINVTDGSVISIH
ncbi:MAG: PepSY domain-containing protein [Nitrosomonas sp.]